MDARLWKATTIIAFSALLLAGFYVTYSFLDIILVAVIISYMVRPAKEKLPFKNETLSTLLAEVAVLIPLFLFLAFTFFSLVNALVTQHALRTVLQDIGTIEETISRVMGNLLQFLGIGETQIAAASLEMLTSRIEVITQEITETIITWAFKLPSVLINLFLATFLSFYFVRDGKNLKDALIGIAPDSQREKVERVITACDAVIYGIVVGYLSKAIITAFLSIIVFYFLGIGNPFVMGVVLAVFDFIPLIGPWTVFLGLFLWYALQGQVGYAIQVAGICYLTISLIPELYIRPKVSGTISQVHPIVMLVGILGGLISLGAIGVLAGPLILGMIVVIIKSYFLDMRIEREDIIGRTLVGVRARMERVNPWRGRKKPSEFQEEHPEDRQPPGREKL
ncbi:MAG: AI-2E family transporter [Theionarchaea archaeon]|nr:AI-2E family transporter [Theionarchaea archaeon]MBU7001868.1 AI-2E family transporter [Theionarchaea archaeon]MBU7022307.1 AI-2E family transporter [Theionarchaea archaeon]MBU7035062.1 AI-2E family transporter [Theionarchaea archaeon]MBU7040662.1 AI-2E family transporter [Theionarchaea archaeon]